MDKLEREELRGKMVSLMDPGDLLCGSVLATRLSGREQSGLSHNRWHGGVGPVKILRRY